MKIKICIITMAILSLLSAAVLAGCGNTGNNGRSESAAESIQSSVSESSEEPSETESTDNSTTDESKTESSSDTVTSAEESRPESSSEVDSSTETSVDVQSSVTDKSDNGEVSVSSDENSKDLTLDKVKEIISEYKDIDKILEEVKKIQKPDDSESVTNQKYYSFFIDRTFDIYKNNIDKYIYIYPESPEVGYGKVEYVEIKYGNPTCTLLYALNNRNLTLNEAQELSSNDHDTKSILKKLEKIQPADKILYTDNFCNYFFYINSNPNEYILVTFVSSDDVCTVNYEKTDSDGNVITRKMLNEY